MWFFFQVLIQSSVPFDVEALQADRRRRQEECVCVGGGHQNSFTPVERFTAPQRFFKDSKTKTKKVLVVVGVQSLFRFQERSKAEEALTLSRCEDYGH